MNRTPRAIKVLIIEDHPLFREGLERALSLEDDIRVIGHAKNGLEGIRATRNMRPDVILLDVNLPDMNGLQVSKQIKNEQPGTAVIVLTAYHETTQVLYAMRSGASAYCGKDISPDNLVSIIRDTAANYYVVDGKRMDYNALENWIQETIESIIGPNGSTDSDKQLIPLSRREMEILQSVTRGMSNKEIATDLGISQQTVKNHMTSILRKLNVEDRTQAAVKALRHGWVRIDEDEG